MEDVESFIKGLNNSQLRELLNRREPILEVLDLALEYNANKVAAGNGLFIVGNKSIPIELQLKAVQLAGEHGYISDILYLLGKKSAPHEVQNLAIEIAGSRLRVFDLIYYLDNRNLHSDVQKKMQSVLFDCLDGLKNEGYVSDFFHYMESSRMPKYIKDRCKDVLPQTFDIAKLKGYYNKMGDLIGSSWVPISIQIQAFEFIEHRLKDYELPLLLKQRKLNESVQFRIAESMEKRGMADKISSSLRARKLIADRKQGGEILSLKDFRRQRASRRNAWEANMQNPPIHAPRLRRRQSY